MTMPIAVNIPVLMPSTPSEVTQVERVVSAHVGQPPLRALITSTGTVLTRTVTIQVVNAKRGACIGLFDVLLVVGLVETDGGSGTQTLAVPTAGKLVATHTANVSGTYFTDIAGKIVLDVTQSGAWSSRFIRAVVRGVVDSQEVL